MMQQYREAKARHPGMLAAVPQGRLLRAVRGRRRARLPRARPHADQPRQAPSRWPASRTTPLEHYLGKLLHAGHRVAVCDQVEDAGPGQGAHPPRGHPRRHPRHRHRGRAARPAAGRTTWSPLVAGKARVGLAWVDLSTGDVPRRRRAAPTGWPTSSPASNPAECLVAEAAPAAADERVRAALPRTPSPPGPTGRSTRRRPAAALQRALPGRHAGRLRLRRRPAVRRPPPGRCSSTCRRRSRRAWPTSAGCGRTGPTGT